MQRIPNRFKPRPIADQTLFASFRVPKSEQLSKLLMIIIFRVIPSSIERQFQRTVWRGEMSWFRRGAWRFSAPHLLLFGHAQHREAARVLTRGGVPVRWSVEATCILAGRSDAP